MANKLLLVAVLAAALLSFTALHAWASVPNPDNSTCALEWVYPGATLRVIACPAGDGSALAGSVTVRDQFNVPMAGVAVVVDVDFFCDHLVWCKTPAWLPDTTLITDGGGVARLPVGIDHSTTGLHFCAGRDVIGPPEIVDCCSVQYTVTCLGVQLCQVTTELVSVDLNQNPGSALYVEALDHQVFSVDYLSNTCRSDFNGTSEDTPTGTWAVAGLDISLFNEHWLHACEVQPPPATTEEVCP
ncbi:MAG: hypothetical protein JSW03_02860 [Candidatus Eiseniibacteriota bacterium]|nr:MAG: hypothetical protein JSW03_02860 [Candidatus Eisenbacteria bacterium]